MNTKELYRKAYRDARILKFQFPPMYPTSAAAIPLHIKLAARQSVEADEHAMRSSGYAWVDATRQHQFEAMTSPSLQY